MKDRNHLEQTIRERLLNSDNFSPASQSAVDALQRSLHVAIGGRSPQEIAQARTGRALRRGTGIAGLLWALLVAGTFVVEDFSETSKGVLTTEPDLVYQEEILFERTDEATVLSAMLGEGLNP